MKISMSYEEYKKLEEISLNLIEQYHKDDVDKGGNPYKNHLVSVSSVCNSYEAKIAGLLHDIIEDTQCDEEVLLNAGVPNYIIDIILLVTRKENESYSDFITRIEQSNNIFAMELKCSDLKNNCDLSRLKNASEEVIKKAEKRIKKRYIPALIRLENKLKELNK